MVIHSLSKRQHGGSTYVGSRKQQYIKSGYSSTLWVKHQGYLSNSVSDLFCHYRTDPPRDFVIRMQKTIVDVKYLGPHLKEKTSSTCSHSHVKLASATKLVKLFQTDLILFAWNCMMKIVWEMCGIIWTLHFWPVKDCKPKPEKENCTKGYSFSFQKT